MDYTELRKRKILKALNGLTFRNPLEFDPYKDKPWARPMLEVKIPTIEETLKLQTDPAFIQLLNDNNLMLKAMGKKDLTADEIQTRVDNAAALNNGITSNDIYANLNDLSARNLLNSFGDDTEARDLFINSLNSENKERYLKLQKGIEDKALFEANMLGPINNNSLGISGGDLAAGAIALSNGMESVFMGDKNFGTLSQAIDGAVDAAATTLMSTGNPYAMAAAGALETANFLTKAGGKTVEGYSVDINNSGYSGLENMQSQSSRDFATAIGLGGVFNNGQMQKKLQRRNLKAMMALNAAELSEEAGQEYMARQDSVDNVLRRNQVALAGGTEISSLGG